MPSRSDPRLHGARPQGRICIAANQTRVYPIRGVPHATTYADHVRNCFVHHERNANNCGNYLDNWSPRRFARMSEALGSRRIEEVSDDLCRPSEAICRKAAAPNVAIRQQRMGSEKSAIAKRRHMAKYAVDLASNLSLIAGSRQVSRRVYKVYVSAKSRSSVNTLISNSLRPYGHSLHPRCSADGDCEGKACGVGLKGRKCLHFDIGSQGIAG